jgi:hypothetical protein
MITRRWTVHPNALTAHLAEGSVVLHMDTKLYFQLNATAALVWRGIEQGLTEGEIVAEMCKRYEVSETVAHDALARLVNGLVRRDLVAAI